VCVFWSNFLSSLRACFGGVQARGNFYWGMMKCAMSIILKSGGKCQNQYRPLRLSVRATRTPIAAAARRRRRSFPNHGRAHTKVSRRPPPPLSGSGSHSACIMRAAHADFPNFRQIKGCTTSGGYTTSSKQPHGRF
jgi:hypothetical protein